MTNLPELHDQPSNVLTYTETITKIRDYDFVPDGIYTFDDWCQIHKYSGIIIDVFDGKPIHPDGARSYWCYNDYEMYIYPTIPLNVGKSINLFDIIVKNGEIGAKYRETLIYACCKFLKRLFGGEASCWLKDDINYMLEYMDKSPLNENSGGSYFIIDNRMSEQPFDWMSDQCSSGTTERLNEEKLDENIVNMVTTPESLKMRQTRAVGYLYIRTYDSWFGYVFSPFNNEVISTDRDCDRILYCKMNDTTVISATSAESESGYNPTEYTHLYYGTETELQPISYFSPITLSQEVRNDKFKTKLHALKSDLDQDQDPNPTTLETDIKDMFELIEISDINDMVTKMITITPEPHVDRYLRDSLKVILSELDFLYECVELFLTPSEDYLTEADLNKLKELISLDVIQTYSDKWPGLRNRLVHTENDSYEWYPGATGRTQQNLRLALWSEISGIMPVISMKTSLDTFEKGYTQFYNRGIIYTTDVTTDSVLSNEHTVPTENEQGTNGYYVTNYSQSNGKFTLKRYVDKQWSATRYILTANINNIKMMYVLWSYLGNRLLCSLQLFDWQTGTNFYFLQRDSELIKNSARFCISDTMEFESEQESFLNQIMTGTIQSNERVLDIHLIYGLYNLLERAAPSEWNAYSNYIPLMRRPDFDIEIRETSPNVVLSYCEPDTEYCMEYKELPAQSFTELSETQIEKDGTVYNKVILMKIGDSYLPWLQIDWGSIVPEEYTSHVIETPTTLDKATYVEFMTSTITVQMTVLRQLITIADECIKTTVSESGIYRLESYGITEIAHFASVVTKMIQNEQTINEFIQTNLNTIKELLPQKNGESDTEWLSRITGGRYNIPDYISGINSALEGIYANNQIYEGIDPDIANSESRRTRWINLKSAFRYMMTMLFNVLITDILKYSTGINWIYKKNGSIFMTTDQIEISDAEEYQIIN